MSNGAALTTGHTRLTPDQTRRWRSAHCRQLTGRTGRIALQRLQERREPVRGPTDQSGCSPTPGRHHFARSARLLRRPARRGRRPRARRGRASRPAAGRCRRGSRSSRRGCGRGRRRGGARRTRPARRRASRSPTGRTVPSTTSAPPFGERQHLGQPVAGHLAIGVGAGQPQPARIDRARPARQRQRSGVRFPPGARRRSRPRPGGSLRRRRRSRPGSRPARRSRGRGSSAGRAAR